MQNVYVCVERITKKRLNQDKEEDRIKKKGREGGRETRAGCVHGDRLKLLHAVNRNHYLRKGSVSSFPLPPYLLFSLSSPCCLPINCNQTTSAIPTLTVLSLLLYILAVKE